MSVMCDNGALIKHCRMAFSLFWNNRIRALPPHMQSNMPWKDQSYNSILTRMLARYIRGYSAKQVKVSRSKSYARN